MCTHNHVNIILHWLMESYRDMLFEVIQWCLFSLWCASYNKVNFCTRISYYIYYTTLMIENYTMKSEFSIFTKKAQ